MKNILKHFVIIALFAVIPLGLEAQTQLRDGTVSGNLAQREREQERQAQQQRIAAAGHINLYSAFSGTVLINDEETEYTVEADKTTLILAYDAINKEIKVAVREENGTVRQQTGNPIIFTTTGSDSRNRVSAVVLNPNPPVNSEDDFGIRQNAQGGITITRYLGTRRQVVIPSTISGIRVTEIGDGAFAPVTEQTHGGNIGWIRKVIYSVTIPASVTRIGNGAFLDCGILAVTIPPNVTYIGTSAFEGNFLTEIVLPNSVTTIGAFCFSGNNIQKITFSNRLSVIPQGAFYGNKLEDIVIPGNVTQIYSEIDNRRDEIWSYGYSGYSYKQYMGDPSAFGDNQLTRVVISNGVTSIEANSFKGNPIETLVIPQSLRHFAAAFTPSGAWGGMVPFGTITSITLPANVDDHNLSSNFHSTLLDFYKSQNKRAGTYRFDGRIWTVR